MTPSPDEEHIKVTPKGLYCPLGDFYIDPWQAVPNAVITHAHADHARPGCGQYYAHPHTIAVLEKRWEAPFASTSFDYHHGPKLGEAQISFHSAGHILGSAQVKITIGGQTTVVAGDYKRCLDPTCPPFEVVPCDTFVTEATFGLPVYHWPEPSQVAATIVDWWQLNRAAGKPSLLFGYSLGKAQRLLLHLGEHELPGPLFLHPATARICGVYTAHAGIAFPEYQILDPDDSSQKQSYAGALLLAPPHLSTNPWMKRFRGAVTGMASGWMTLRGQKRRRGYDKGFVMSDHADWPSLIQTVQQTGAEKVFVTHGYNATLARYLEEQGITALELNTLFDGEGD